MKPEIGVMIVDDEYIVREDIKALVDWEALGFRILCEATNGKQGIEYFRKYRPDLVIADIKMPLMNGLDMAEAILKIAPHTKFLLLTAYNEFDYARTAMRLGIHHYLLKHEIDSQSLEHFLTEYSAHAERLAEHRWESATLCARDIILGTAPRENSGRQALEELIQKGMVAFLLFRGGRKIALEEQKKLIFRREKQVNAQLISEDQRALVVLFAFSVPSELAYYQSISQYISQVMADLGSPAYPIDVAVSDRWRDLDSLKPLYRRTLASLDTAVFQREHGKIIRGEASPSQEIDHGGLYEFMMTLKNHLTSQDYDKIYQDCRDYVLEQCAPQKRIDQFRLWRTFLIGMLEDHNNFLSGLASSCLESLSCETDTVFEFLDKLQSVLESFAGIGEKSLSKTMRKVISYIGEHYSDNLTLEEIASVMAMNAVYLGQIFKREMGVPFKQYLADLRIEKAKELLRSGNYKIYQVAEMVGYQTTQYFCSVFKRVTGVSPTEYAQHS